MKTLSHAIPIAAAAALSFVAVPAEAAPRTFVASYGSDANPCSRVSPCRSFGVAMAHTDDAGEVIVLDSAGYGSVIIAQNVSITAPPGIYAGISVFSGSGVLLNLTHITVTLRGLTINGQGAGTIGIDIMQDADVFVEGCTIRNMGSDGVRAESSIATVTIVNSSITKSAGAGIRIGPSLIATIADSRIESNGGFGVWLLDGASATIERSMIANNALNGIQVTTGVSPSTMLVLNSSVVSDHPAGGGVSVQTTVSGASAQLDISGNTFARNDNGIEAGSMAGTMTRVNATNNQISDSSFAGIFANGPGTIVRASGNSMFRAQYGILTQNGAIVYSPSPGTNYVRDNTTQDDSTHTADSFL